MSLVESECNVPKSEDLARGKLLYWSHYFQRKPTSVSVKREKKLKEKNTAQNYFSLVNHVITLKQHRATLVSKH